MPIKNILVAADDSPDSRKAAKFAFELARVLHARIGLVSVVNKGRELVNPDLGVSFEEKRAALYQNAQTVINQCIGLYGDGIAVIPFAPEGSPGKEILKLAAEWPADLIVLGTHLHGKIELLLQGSLTEYLIRHAVVPVIVAPPGMR
ncbi:MAG TPA: universal stress protein [Puia sp.]|nr:universal stress protein [Puia sp.]